MLGRILLSVSTLQMARLSAILLAVASRLWTVTNSPPAALPTRLLVMPFVGLSWPTVTPSRPTSSGHIPRIT